MRPLLLFVAVGALLACHSGSGSSSGGMGMQYPSPCPGSAPVAGSACQDDGLTCEFGSEPNATCDSQFSCNGGSWASVAMVDAGLACDPSYTGSCQPTYDMQKAAGMTGACAPTGLVCGFPQGTCGCVPPGGAVSLDGGPVTQTAHWVCTDLPSGCPAPRPRLGDGCATVGQLCDYAACWGGVQLGCTSDHTWEEAPATCPQGG